MIMFIGIVHVIGNKQALIFIIMLPSYRDSLCLWCLDLKSTGSGWLSIRSKSTIHGWSSIDFPMLLVYSFYIDYAVFSSKWKQ